VTPGLTKNRRTMKEIKAQKSPLFPDFNDKFLKVEYSRIEFQTCLDLLGSPKILDKSLIKVVMYFDPDLL